MTHKELDERWISLKKCNKEKLWPIVQNVGPRRLSVMNVEENFVQTVMGVPAIALSAGPPMSAVRIFHLDRIRRNDQ